MKPITLGLLIAASVSLPGYAAEPDGPGNLITRTEAVRITVQNLLSSESDASSRKAKNDALVEYYSVPDQRLLWVDENGLTERAKAGGTFKSSAASRNVSPRPIGTCLRETARRFSLKAQAISSRATIPSADWSVSINLLVALYRNVLPCRAVAPQWGHRARA